MDTEKLEHYRKNAKRLADQFAKSVENIWPSTLIIALDYDFAQDYICTVTLKDGHKYSFDMIYAPYSAYWISVHPVGKAVGESIDINVDSIVVVESHDVDSWPN